MTKDTLLDGELHSQIHISAYRVLRVLVALIQEPHQTLDTLRQVLRWDVRVGRMVSDDTLLRYLTTLECAGCVVERLSGEGTAGLMLRTHPFPNPQLQPWVSAGEAVFSLLRRHPDPLPANAFRQLLRRMIWASGLPDHGEEQLPLLAESPLLAEARALCGTGHVVEITLQPSRDGNTPEPLRMALLGVLVLDGRLHLQGEEVHSYQFYVGIAF